jgi:hypothetical protein
VKHRLNISAGEVLCEVCSLSLRAIGGASREIARAPVYTFTSFSI